MGGLMDKAAYKQVPIRLELVAGAFERFMKKINDSREIIDAGIMGTTDAQTALTRARGKLAEIGMLLRDEIVIVQDPVTDPENTKKGDSHGEVQTRPATHPEH